MKKILIVSFAIESIFFLCAIATNKLIFLVLFAIFAFLSNVLSMVLYQQKKEIKMLQFLIVLETCSFMIMLAVYILIDKGKLGTVTLITACIWLVMNIFFDKIFVCIEKHL